MVVLTRVAAVVLLSATGLGAGSGCSILFAKGPPERVEPHERVRCSQSYVFPVLDGVMTAFQIVRTLYAVSLKDSDYKNPNFPRAADIGIGAGLSGLFLVSTGIGVSRVGDCNELIEKIENRPEPRRMRPTPNPFAPPTPREPDADADPERAAAASAAEEAKEAGRAAGASVRKPAAPPEK